jgi:hypothetical protein
MAAAGATARMEASKRRRLVAESPSKRLLATSVRVRMGVGVRPRGMVTGDEAVYSGGGYGTRVGRVVEGRCGGAWS